MFCCRAEDSKKVNKLYLAFGIQEKMEPDLEKLQQVKAQDKDH